MMLNMTDDSQPTHSPGTIMTNNLDTHNEAHEHLAVSVRFALNSHLTHEAHRQKTVSFFSQSASMYSHQFNSTAQESLPKPHLRHRPTIY